MDARQLTYFLAVVEHLNFGRAADQLHIAQPSLSQAIATLERELGVPLFHRVGRGIVLSDAGAQLVEPARRVIRDLQAAGAAVRSAGGLGRGRVELVAMPSPTIEPLSTLVRDFTERHPGMTVRVDAAFTADEVVLAVKAGRAELGLLGAASATNTSGLHAIAVEEQPLVLISPPDAVGHDEGTARTPAGVVAWEQMAGMRLIVSTPGSHMRRYVDEVLASGVHAEIVVEVEHRTSIVPLVLRGVGHAVMPASWTTLATRAGAVVRPLEPTSLLRVELVARTAALTPAAQAFVVCVEQYAAARAEARPGCPQA